MSTEENQPPIEIDCASTSEILNSENNDILLLDCREQNEFNIVNIAGATLLPMSEIQQRISELEEYRDREIIVYCHHGMRSLNVAQWMRQQGFSKVQSMSGGIDYWAMVIDRTLSRY